MSSFLQDGHSGTRALLDSAGAISDRYDYGAFGRLLQSTGTSVNPYLYRGQQFDPTLGQYYLRARYYDQSSGRFASVDPFGGFVEQPMSLHDYLYANDNPVRFEDPSGQYSMAEIGVTLGIVTALSGLAIASIQQIVSRALFGLSKTQVTWSGVGTGGGVGATIALAGNVLDMDSTCKKQGTLITGKEWWRQRKKVISAQLFGGIGVGLSVGATGSLDMTSPGGLGAGGHVFSGGALLASANAIVGQGSGWGVAIFQAGFAYSAEISVNFAIWSLDAGVQAGYSIPLHGGSLEPCTPASS